MERTPIGDLIPSDLLHQRRRLEKVFRISCTEHPCPDCCLFLASDIINDRGETR